MLTSLQKPKRALMPSLQKPQRQDGEQTVEARGDDRGVEGEQGVEAQPVNGCVTIKLSGRRRRWLKLTGGLKLKPHTRTGR